MTNEVQFNVEGLGVFTAYKEVPAKTFFADERNELAKLCGGRVELVKMEATLRRYRESSDPVERATADQIAWELGRARAIIDVRNLIKDSPKGFVLENLSMAQFDLLWIALVGARDPFPEDDKTGKAEPSKTS